MSPDALNDRQTFRKGLDGGQQQCRIGRSGAVRPQLRYRIHHFMFYRTFDLKSDLDSNLKTIPGQLNPDRDQTACRGSHRFFVKRKH